MVTRPTCCAAVAAVVVVAVEVFGIVVFGIVVSPEPWSNPSPCGRSMVRDEVVP